MSMSIVRKGSQILPTTKYEIQLLRKARDVEEYLSNKEPMQSDKLKARLLNENYLEPKCSFCGLTRWLDGEMPLQLDHKDGNKENNNLQNLRLLCPNCHALTPQYRLKNEHKGDTYSNRDNPNGNRA